MILAHLILSRKMGETALTMVYRVPKNHDVISIMPANLLKKIIFGTGTKKDSRSALINIARTHHSIIIAPHSNGC